MGTPFIAEVKLISWNYAPKGWAFCNGQLMPINQNQPLFALIGTTYGGDGRVNFALPDLRGRVPIHFDGEFTLGQRGGEEAHTLTMSEMTQHIHTASASTTVGNTNLPSGNVLGGSAPNTLYGPAQNLGAMNVLTLANVGGSQAHENRQPFLTLNYCIALTGAFPSRN
jgi:microcystin-dependent protein